MTITKVISEHTVVMKSLLGRLYKSNMARLQPWRGRDLTNYMYGEGVEEVLPESENNIY